MYVLEHLKLLEGPVHILPVLTICADAVLCHVKDSTTQPNRMAMFLIQLPGILHRGGLYR